MDAKSAIYHYCNYQDRCHAEVRNKLYELGCTTPEVEELIANLIEAGLLNEERYARSYARGKFRTLKWGRTKIIQQLKLHKISDYCIRKGMSEIDADEYDNVLTKLAEKKWQELRSEKNIFARRKKVYRYLLQKGYEADMVQAVIHKMVNPDG